MGTIHILDETLINKISAGEVIERPAAVVKELMENAIDAGGDHITITIGEGGKSYIKVEDNGEGMSKEDAVISIQRHATSKIKDTSDLFNINTLGFRGEALASIASISILRVISRTKNDPVGTQIDVEGSKIRAIKEIGCNKGTIIEVSSLFYNTPARKEYMKSMRQEHNVILDIVTRYALAYNNISFRLLHGNKVILNSPKVKSLLDNIVSIYGAELGKNLIKVKYKSDVLEIKGYISKPNTTRGDKGHQSLFINGRYVKSKAISNGIYEGYHSMIFTGRHPISVLFVNIDPQKIDVNVHPTKDVIRLKEEEKVYTEVMTAVQNALESSDLTPSVTIDSYSNIKSTKRYPLQKDKQEVLMVKEESPKTEKITTSKVEESGIGAYRIIGQINRTYILAESPEGLLVIDQHAAEERVNYELLMKEYEDKGIKVQKLVKPQIIDIIPAESAVIFDNLDILKKAGFEIEQYGKSSFLIRTIPAIFGRYYDSLIFDLIKEMRAVSTKKINAIKEERIIRFSCRKSIKAGKEMTIGEMEKLLKKLDKANKPFTCPHGRPTIIKISIGELEKKFKRTG